MSCDLHKIGTSVKVAKTLQRKVHGKPVKVLAGATGKITAINRQNHTLHVHFLQTRTTVTLPAKALVGKKPKRDLVMSRMKAGVGKKAKQTSIVSRMKAGVGKKAKRTSVVSRKQRPPKRRLG